MITREQRAWGIAQEAYDAFKSGRCGLGGHHLLRLGRMYRLALDELTAAAEGYRAGTRCLSESFAEREVRKSLGIEADIAWCRTVKLRGEMERKLIEDKRKYSPTTSYLNLVPTALQYRNNKF